MNSSERSKLLSVKGLSDMPKGVLLEISDIVTVESEHGKYGVAEYATTLADKTRQHGKVRLSENVMAVAALVPPCIALYQGMKTSASSGRTFHDVAAVKSNERTMKEQAENMRKLSKAALLATMTTQTLDDFEAGTVFIFKDVKKRRLRKDFEEAVMVSYETKTAEGEFVNGVVVVPQRIESDLRRHGSGIMIYHGKKTSQTGRLYNDIVVVGEDLVGSI